MSDAGLCRKDGALVDLQAETPAIGKAAPSTLGGHVGLIGCECHVRFAWGLLIGRFIGIWVLDCESLELVGELVIDSSLALVANGSEVTI